MRCECSTKTDMGANGETCAIIVSDSVEDGKSTENHTHRATVGSNHGY